ncbi:P-loop containing nucleoside triphosphate hydrolase protein, partial [Fistulina hepatica ATCC 64428]
PMKLALDKLEAKHWIYPLNRPKRDYQFNIVRHALFENTIVALPTGLGKTLIAGVIMLNYYRWFPEGKVVFAAPTKPLVAQQIEASHEICGIPGSDAVELTGEVPAALRHRAWAEKRVFYMTPQTLINDLERGTCDPLDIILIVIDEAHRATGDYAYNKVIRYMMAKNPHFRVLALTATPGSTPDAVQALVDGLHISHIEIRDETSLDLRQYTFEKQWRQVFFVDNRYPDEKKIAQVYIKPLHQKGVWRGSPFPEMVSPFTPQMLARELPSHQRWAYGSLMNASTLARAMGYLIEGTMSMCYKFLRRLQEQEDDPTQEKKSKKSGKKISSDPAFQATLVELELQRAPGFPIHPKMDRLRTLIIQYFADRSSEREKTDSKAMVFVTFREVVDEIVDVLSAHTPLIRATRFIGQGTDKEGGKGMSQKEQLEVIKRFKEGEFNILVATSVGEEGLDIGEVDLIACYDAQKTPIRMLQRLGRTGRKRAGLVHVLLAEGREEQNLDKAKATYKEVQKSIVRGEQLELYGDVERLLPDNIKPQCLEKVMDIQPYVRED